MATVIVRTLCRDGDRCGSRLGSFVNISVCRPSVSQVRRAAAASKYRRLPTHSVPLHYRLSIKPDLDKFAFAGKQTIDVQVHRPTNRFTLNCKELDVRDVTVLASGNEFSDLPVETNDSEEKIDIHLPVKLSPGKVKLSMQFTGKLNDHMRGFYRSKYRVPGDNKDRFMASTQFESTYARWAFPCWDEPVYKATFHVTLTVKKSLTALSNAHVIHEKSLAGGWKEVQFAPSPLMSSYLVAFAVGNLAYKESQTKEGINVRVYTLPHSIQHADFALECARRALEYYNEFFDIVYPMKKCDQLAIPDFSMGAMENWGLVTYREVLLLVDPSRTSFFIKSRVALVIAHELAHMWFGDLVTMKWWTDLWLKEGFANFIMYLFVEHAYPELEIMLRFVSEEIVPALNLDALKSSHPIEVPIDNPNELDEIYDNITYAKGCSVNRMLYSYLGHETWKAGLRAYLKKYAYSNATTQDLWDVFSDVSNEDIGALMSSWTQQMGFPVVTAAVQRYGDHCKLTLSQERFLADGTKDVSCLWRVPVTVLSAGNPAKPLDRLLLTERKQVFTLDVPDGQWIKLNAGMTGYYRVAYSSAMAGDLLEPLKQQAFGPADRFNLFSDVFALVRAGRASATTFLDLLTACAPTEEHLIVWQQVDAAVASISNVLLRAPKNLSKRFDDFVIEQYLPVAAKLGWKPAQNEPPTRSTLRGLVLGRLGKAGHPDTIATAQKLFDEHVRGDKNLQSDIRGAVYAIVARYGGKQAFDDMTKINETTDFPEIQRNALLSLGCSSDEQLHAKCLHYTIHSGQVRKQDMLLPFASCTGTRVGQEHLWTYFKRNMHHLIEMYGGANNLLFQHTLQLCISSHCHEHVASEAETLIRSSEFATTLDRPMRQAVEAVRLNVTLLGRNSQPIEKWLAEHKY